MNDLVALQSISRELAQSRLHAHRNPADVLFVILVGEFLGLNAATALMNIYNVNGMPTMKFISYYPLKQGLKHYPGLMMPESWIAIYILLSIKTRIETNRTKSSNHMQL